MARGRRRPSYTAAPAATVGRSPTYCECPRSAPNFVTRWSYDFPLKPTALDSPSRGIAWNNGRQPSTIASSQQLLPPLTPTGASRHRERSRLCAQCPPPFPKHQSAHTAGKQSAQFTRHLHLRIHSPPFYRPLPFHSIDASSDVRKMTRLKPGGWPFG